MLGSSQVAPGRVDPEEEHAVIPAVQTIAQSSPTQALHTPRHRSVRQALRRLSTATSTIVATVREHGAGSGQNALRAMVGILKDALLSTIGTWLACYCATRGNIFSGRSLLQQSYFEFVLAAALLNNAFYEIVYLGIQTSILGSVRFLVAPDRAPGYVYCLGRLARASWKYYPPTVALITLCLWALEQAPLAVRNYKPEYYAMCICGLGCMTGIYLESVGIYRHETVIGAKKAEMRRIQQQHSHQRLHRTSTAPSLPHSDPEGPHAGSGPSTSTSTSTSTRHRPVAAAMPHRLYRSVVRFARGYVLHSLSRFFVVIFAAVYVQIASRLEVVTQQDTALFLACSLAFRLGAQELIHALVIRSKLQDIRALFAATGIPIVLIDTQVYVMLQRLSSVNTTISASIFMTLLELLARAARVALLWYQLWRRQHQRASRPAASVTPDRPFSCESISKDKPRRATSPSASLPPPTREIEAWPSRVVSTFQLRLPATSHFPLDPDGDEQWRKRVLAVHAAEVYAEMCAEYIAIGSAAAVLFCCWDHPKYDLGNWRRDAALAHDPEAASSWNMSSVLGLQIVMELTVDYLSCLVELSAGVDFSELQRYSGFVAVFFVCAGTLNVQISSILYLKTEP